MAVNRRPSKERLNLDPGLSGKTNFGGNHHLKLFLNVSQTKLKGRTGKCRSTRVFFWEPGGGSNFVKFRELLWQTRRKTESVQSSGRRLAIEGAACCACHKPPGSSPRSENRGEEADVGSLQPPSVARGFQSSRTEKAKKTGRSQSATAAGHKTGRRSTRTGIVLTLKFFGRKSEGKTKTSRTPKGDISIEL